MNLLKSFLILLSIVGIRDAHAQANTSLSNLGATNINSSLLFDTDNSYDIGGVNETVANIYTRTIRSGVASSSLDIQTLDSASGITARLNIKGGDNSDATPFPGGEVWITGGSSTAGGPGGQIVISAGSGTGGGDIVMSVGGTTGQLVMNGHIQGGGFYPTVSSCGGGSPSISGSDTAGKINVGTSTSTCTVNFGSAWPSAPICVVSNETARIAMRAVPGTTTLVISAAANFAASTVLNYICFGR